MNLNRVTGATAALLLAACPLRAPAADLFAESRSYLRSVEAANDDRHVTFYEYFDTDLLDSGDAGFSFHAGGWARADLDHESFGKHANGELQYAYLRYLAVKGDTTACLGRLYLTEGVASGEQMDGLRLGTSIPAGFDLSAYVGSPAELHDGQERSSQLIYGGRLSQGSSFHRLGVSYLKERDSDGDFREEAGADVYFRPVRALELAGLSAYNVMAEEWMEHDYSLTVRIPGGVRVVGTAGWVDYENFFQSALNSAFSPSFIDPKEKLTTLGGRVEYVPVENLTVVAEYKHYDYKVAEPANYYSGSLVFAPEGMNLGLLFGAMRGEADPLRYYLYRAWSSRTFGRLDATVDLLDINYDEAQNGVRNTYALSASLGWRSGDAFRIAADLEYGHNAFFEDEVKAMLKVGFRVPNILARERGPKQ